MTLRGVGTADKHGVQPAIMCGYAEAAILSAWTITKTRDPKTRAVTWRLLARAVRMDAFLLGHAKALAFTAPRPGGQLWRFPVKGRVEVYAGNQLGASLGLPEF